MQLSLNRVDCPGGMAKGFIVPDLVLFVNGIPLVVVECKSPGVAEPLPSAVDQLRRYSNQRKAACEIEDNEGNERLFHTNQFLVATSFDEARVGTIGADMQHYLESSAISRCSSQWTAAWSRSSAAISSSARCRRR